MLRRACRGLSRALTCAYSRDANIRVIRCAGGDDKRKQLEELVEQIDEEIEEEYGVEPEPAEGTVRALGPGGGKPESTLDYRVHARLLTNALASCPQTATGLPKEHFGHGDVARRAAGKKGGEIANGTTPVVDLQLPSVIATMCTACRLVATCWSGSTA